MYLDSVDFLENLKKEPNNSDLYRKVRNWQNEYGSLELENFKLSEKLLENQTIHVKDIIGSTHSDYVNQRWIDFFLNLGVGRRGKRLEFRLLDLENSFEYLESSFEKDTEIPHYFRVNGVKKYFVDVGQHRTHIIKALYNLGEHDGFIKGINIVDHSFDLKLYEGFINLREKISKKEIPYKYVFPNKYYNDFNGKFGVSLKLEPNNWMIRDLKPLKSIEEVNKVLNKNYSFFNLFFDFLIS